MWAACSATESDRRRLRYSLPEARPPRHAAAAFHRSEPASKISDAKHDKSWQGSISRRRAAMSSLLWAYAGCSTRRM